MFDFTFMETVHFVHTQTYRQQHCGGRRDDWLVFYTTVVSIRACIDVADERWRSIGKGRPAARPNQPGCSWPIDPVLTLDSEVHISKAMIDVHWGHQSEETVQ
jgi:hypothetical protein